jgi:hypothetical protein
MVTGTGDHVAAATDADLDADDLTGEEKYGTLGLTLDSDDLLAYHYLDRSSAHRRRVLFRVRDGLALFQHPAQKIEIPLGHTELDGIYLVVRIPLARVDGSG